ncbi:MAG: 6-phosphogluconolactonase [Phycisphaerales bacterium]
MPAPDVPQLRCRFDRPGRCRAFSCRSHTRAESEPPDAWGSFKGAPATTTRTTRDRTGRHEPLAAERARGASTAAEAGRVVANVLTDDAPPVATAVVLRSPSPADQAPDRHSPSSRDATISRASTHLLWVDERAVPIEDADSNYADLAREILPRLPLDPAHIHRMRGELGADDGAREYRDTLARVLAGEPLDAALLGIGEDGHVASLFPGSPSLAERDPVIAITDSPKPPPERITLTLPMLRGARRIVLLGLGPAKADAIARCLAGDPLPARLASDSDNAIWVIDDAAAARAPNAITRPT